VLLGCIADDFTGATDLANNLVRGGMRTMQTIGVPRAPLAADVDAVVVALKSRTIPASEAVAQSLAALDWLKAQRCRQFYLKYCSTFDSTPAGNIGPVIDALMAALQCDFTIACPAFPENQRTVFKGYLFAGDVPLNESGMAHHPLTPMTDANLIRVLQAQTRSTVGHVGYETVATGAPAIRARFAALRAKGAKIAIVDAISDDDLIRIGEAVDDLPLVTAGSGVAIGLTERYRNAGLLTASAQAARLPGAPGYRAIVSGSCSAATNAQVADFIEAGGAAYPIDPLALDAGEPVIERALQWARPLLERSTTLIYATAKREAVRAVQERLGAERASLLVEQALAEIAQRLIDAGVRQLVVAGGETAGAVVHALGVEALRIGPQIDPGVPWTATTGARPLLLALKSGNFGARDFFRKAFDLLG
jgi:3-dehydrotetronate 4-kinase